MPDSPVTTAAAFGSRSRGAQGGRAAAERLSRLCDDRNPTRRGLHRARRAWIEEHLARHAKPGSAALEIGVGCGSAVRFLAARGVEVTALDIDPELLERLHDVPGVSLLCADATEAWNLQDFDVVLCAETLEHVPPERSQRLLGHLQAALKPGGVLLLTTPQRYSVVELLGRALEWPPVLALAQWWYSEVGKLGHVNLLTARQLEQQVQRAGLVILDLQRLGLYLPVIAELGGRPGAVLLQLLERCWRRVPGLRAALWTQAYVLTRNT